MQMIFPDDGTMQNVSHMFDILEIQAPIMKAKSRVSAKTKQDRSLQSWELLRLVYLRKVKESETEKLA